MDRIQELSALTPDNLKRYVRHATNDAQRNPGRVMKRARGILRALNKENSRRKPAVSEEAPPGREKQVKALKKKFPKASAYAIAWASYNRSKGKVHEASEADQYHHMKRGHWMVGHVEGRINGKRFDTFHNDYHKAKEHYVRMTKHPAVHHVYMHNPHKDYDTEHEWHRPSKKNEETVIEGDKGKVHEAFKGITYVSMGKGLDRNRGYYKGSRPSKVGSKELEYRRARREFNKKLRAERSVKEQTFLEGWHRGPSGEYTAWAADIDHHVRTNKTSAKCPECRSPVAYKHLTKKKDKEGDVTHWTGKCVHCGNVKFTIFNDEVLYDGDGQMLAESYALNELAAKPSDVEKQKAWHAERARHHLKQAMKAARNDRMKDAQHHLKKNLTHARLAESEKARHSKHHWKGDQNDPKAKEEREMIDYRHQLFLKNKDREKKVNEVYKSKMTLLNKVDSHMRNSQEFHASAERVKKDEPHLARQWHHHGNRFGRAAELANDQLLRKLGRDPMPNIERKKRFAKPARFESVLHELGDTWRGRLKLRSYVRKAEASAKNEYAKPRTDHRSNQKFANRTIGMQDARKRLGESHDYHAAMTKERYHKQAGDLMHRHAVMKHNAGKHDEARKLGRARDLHDKARDAAARIMRRLAPKPPRSEPPRA